MLVLDIHFRLEDTASQSRKIKDTVRMEWEPLPLTNRVLGSSIQLVAETQRATLVCLPPRTTYAD